MDPRISHVDVSSMSSSEWSERFERGRGKEREDRQGKELKLS
jgi:hypothetical protein